MKYLAAILCLAIVGCSQVPEDCKVVNEKGDFYSFHAEDWVGRTTEIGPIYTNAEVWLCSDGYRLP